MRFTVKSLEETKKLALAFADSLMADGIFATLTGDIGAGKTQFVRFVLEALNVAEKVTSPSFVILNEYKTARFPVYHFDLYRLEEKGLKSIVSELREYSKPGMLTFIEWAEFAHGEIPKDSLKINVEYDKENLDIRHFDFCAENSTASDFLARFSRKAGY